MFYTKKELELTQNFIESVPKIDEIFLDEMDKVMKEWDGKSVIIIDDDYLLEEEK